MHPTIILKHHAIGILVGFCQTLSQFVRTVRSRRRNGFETSISMIIAAGDDRADVTIASLHQRVHPSYRKMDHLKFPGIHLLQPRRTRRKGLQQRSQGNTQSNWKWLPAWFLTLIQYCFLWQLACSKWLGNLLIQGSAKMLWQGCANAAGQLRQK